MRVLEAIFRRPLRFLALILLVPLVSLAIVYILPRSYQTTARLIALRRYQIIGMASSDADLLATPAQTQANALSELLQTRAFSLSVAKATTLTSTLDATTRADPQLRDDALSAEISNNVHIVALGTTLFTITYTNHNPQLAQEVVTAVIQNYGSQSQSLNTAAGKNLLQGYQTQLAQAKSALNAAVTAAAAYINTQTGVTQAQLLTDQKYILLQAQISQATNTVQSIQNSITGIRQQIAIQGSSANSLFKVIDAPTVSQPVSRLSLFILGGGTGLALALLAATLYIIMLVRYDHSVRTAPDLQQVTDFPVVMQVPYLSSKTVPLLVEASVNSKRLGKGRTIGRVRL